ncbi:hypothetical protein A3A66_00395 [Microgenomates group bacterium RIFCSPLOWO2_01_FULL_46_13]|nr:MAG: hypothetical protein A2783_03915 [Microgenomates group bacterium RIFCSPHIGHO2_01_FULL_45_11]OGV94474.1 MAG: hypothetical protein A3A66_00395 [Microgenomates group bacterium RIFCSPLOWO2_01_FULL_46_13]
MELPENILVWSVVAAVWSLPWKGLALWKAARSSHKGWFVVLLLLNTLGIVEMIYLFLVPPRVSFRFQWGKKER